MPESKTLDLDQSFVLVWCAQLSHATAGCIPVYSNLVVYPCWMRYTRLVYILFGSFGLRCENVTFHLMHSYNSNVSIIHYYYYLPFLLRWRIQQGRIMIIMVVKITINEMILTTPVANTTLLVLVLVPVSSSPSLPMYTMVQIIHTYVIMVVEMY